MPRKKKSDIVGASTTVNPVNMIKYKKELDQKISTILYHLNTDDSITDSEFKRVHIIEKKESLSGLEEIYTIYKAKNDIEATDICKGVSKLIAEKLAVASGEHIASMNQDHVTVTVALETDSSNHVIIHCIFAY